MTPLRPTGHGLGEACSSTRARLAIDRIQGIFARAEARGVGGEIGRLCAPRQCHPRMLATPDLKFFTTVKPSRSLTVTPTYTEAAILNFAQVVRTLTGVQLNQNDAWVELERLREDYASPADRERWQVVLEGEKAGLVDYANA